METNVPDTTNFFTAISGTKDYNELCYVLHQFLRGAVAICNNRMHIMAAYPLNSDTTQAISFMNHRNSGETSSLSAAGTVSAVSNQPVYIGSGKESNSGAFVYTVSYGSLEYAYIIVLDQQKQQQEQINLLLDMASLKIRADFVTSLREFGPFSRVVPELLAALSPNLNEPRNFNAAVLPDFWKGTGYYYMLRLKQRTALKEALSDWAIIEMFPNSGRDVIFRYQGIIIAITKTSSIITNLNEHFHSLIVFCERLHLCIGISRPFQTFQVLPNYYHQSYWAAEHGTELGIQSVLYNYDDFWIDDLLLNRRSDPPISEYVPPILYALQTYDQENRTELVHTLWCFLKNNQSASQTAKELFLHRNTLNARIQKIKSLLQTEEISGEDTLPFLLGLYIMKIIQDSKDNPINNVHMLHPPPGNV